MNVKPDPDFGQNERRELLTKRWGAPKRLDSILLSLKRIS